MTLLWGSLLIIFGIQLIAQALFGINLPLLRVALGFVIIYWGLSIISGDHCYFFWNKTHKNITFMHDTHNVIFGTQYIDLSKINLDKPKTITLNAIFGTARLKLNDDIPTRINANTTFGTIILPDRSANTNGAYVYHTHGYQTPPLLTINANATFGTIVIKE